MFLLNSNFKQAANDSIAWLNSDSTTIKGIPGKIKFTMKNFVSINTDKKGNMNISCCLAGLIEIMRRLSNNESIVDLNILDLWRIFDLKENRNLQDLFYVNVDLREKIRYNSITNKQAAIALNNLLEGKNDYWDHLPKEIFKTKNEEE